MHNFVLFSHFYHFFLDFVCEPRCGRQLAQNRGDKEMAIEHCHVDICGGVAVNVEAYQR